MEYSSTMSQSNTTAPTRNEIKPDVNISTRKYPILMNTSIILKIIIMILKYKNCVLNPAYTHIRNIHCDKKRK